MDSTGNSGSLQSSSGGCGGDEEYDSRTDMISAFINPVATTQPPPPPPCYGKNSGGAVFDNPLLSNYFLPNLPSSTQNLQNPCSSFMNLDMVWSKTNIRSDPNIPLMATSSSSPQPPHHGSQVNASCNSNTGGGGGAAGGYGGSGNGSVSGGGGGVMIAPPPRRGSSSLSTSGNHHHHNQVHDDVVVVRPNPKKRSRASRRAPTTVLITDTTNFRSMVQEFTGIPSPPPLSPFSSSLLASPFPTTTSRFDLFSTSTITRPFTPSSETQQLPYNIHRPFPQKIQQPFPPFSSSLPSSSMVDELSVLKTPIQSNTNLFVTENPIFSSLLQPRSTTTTPKSPLENPEILMGSKPLRSMQLASDEPPMKRVFLDEFGLGHNSGNSNVSRLSCLVSSDQTMMKNDNTLASWGNGAGPNGGDQSPLMIRRSA